MATFGRFCRKSRLLVRTDAELTPYAGAQLTYHQNRITLRHVMLQEVSNWVWIPRQLNKFNISANTQMIYEEI